VNVSSTPTPLIDLENVSRTYDSASGDRVFALKSVNLKIYAGSFTVIRGVTGSGKTTLLKVLGLLDNEFEGSYRFNGETVSDKPNWWRDELRSKNIGFVFQEGRLFNYLSIEQNVRLRYRIMEAQDSGANLTNLIERNKSLFFTGEEIEGKILSRRASEASGGQSQRASVWRATINKPPIVLADEPAANVDPAWKQEILNLLRHAHAQGQTVIVVSHDEIFWKHGTQYELRDGELHFLTGDNESVDIHTSGTAEAHIGNLTGADTQPTPREPGAAIADPHLEMQTIEGISEEKTGASNRSIPTTATKLNGWRCLFGWWPRSKLFVLLHQVWREIIPRPIFPIMILVALIAGICQITLFASVLIGTEQVIDEQIRTGSRLNRVSIKPMSGNLDKDDRFPKREEILSRSFISGVSGRRESVIHLKGAKESDIPMTTLGLHRGDPEFNLMPFLAGGPFTEDPTDLEVIVDAQLLKRLFPVQRSAETGEIEYGNYIGKPIQAWINVVKSEGVRIRHDFNLRLAGIVEHGESNRQVYLPNVTQKAFSKALSVTKPVEPLPIDLEQMRWALSPEELSAFADFAWEDWLDVYAAKVSEAPAVLKFLAGQGYRIKQADIRYDRWVLDVRELVFKLAIPLLVLIAVVGALTVWTNVYASAEIRRNQIALSRILGMRIGDIVFIHVVAAFLIGVVGTGIGIGAAYFLSDLARSLLAQGESFSKLEGLFAPVAPFVGYIFAVAICVTVLAALYPAWRAARTDPARVLRAD